MSSYDVVNSFSSSIEGKVSEYQFVNYKCKNCLIPYMSNYTIDEYNYCSEECYEMYNNYYNSLILSCMKLLNIEFNWLSSENKKVVANKDEYFSLKFNKLKSDYAKTKKFKNTRRKLLKTNNQKRQAY
jgi:ribosomal protein L29